MGDARKYILQKEEIVSTGFTTLRRVVEYDLREAFEGVRPDDSAFAYFTITSNDLIEMDNSSYDIRMRDFLYFVNIPSIDVYNGLVSDSTFDSGDC